VLSKREFAQGVSSERFCPPPPLARITLWAHAVQLTNIDCRYTIALKCK
jgi:hypothetical protein